MNRRIVAVFALLMGALLTAGLTRAEEAKKPGPSKDEVQKAEGVLKEHLEKIKGANGQVQWLGEEPVTRTFPDQIIFAVRYRQFPVARLLPEGLQASNLFVVKDGKLQRLADAKALEKFFREHGGAVKDEKRAKDAAKAWLWLAQEFFQDGFYKLAITEEATQVTPEGDGKKVSGKAVVMAGGNGEMAVELTFDKAGKLTKVAEMTKIKPGPRPICQATKLLDPDPIVRRMAEQDLLYMGLAARDYLFEQRAKASPELRRAIDRIWERIQAAGW
jgi:hypothetical protein